MQEHPEAGRRPPAPSPSPKKLRSSLMALAACAAVSVTLPASAQPQVPPPAQPVPPQPAPPGAQPAPPAQPPAGPAQPVAPPTAEQAPAAPAAAPQAEPPAGAPDPGAAKKNTPSPEKGPSVPMPAGPLLKSGEKRPTSDFDGRPDPTTPGDVLIWIPRVTFFPVYLVTEYVLRQPLGALTRFVEEKKVIEEITNFFTFGPNGTIGIIPTALIDFGLRPSVGVYFFYDEFLAKENHLRLHAAFGGTDWLRLTVADRVDLDDTATIAFRTEAWRRPDGVFYGIGPRTLDEDRVRYAADIFGGSMAFDAKLSPRVQMSVITGVRSLQFNEPEGEEPITCCDDPALRTKIDEGAIPSPPSYDDGGYVAYRQGLSLAFDNRDPRPAPGSGVRLELRGEHDIDLENPANRRWVKWGGTAGAFVDLTGTNRVLSLSISTVFADPLGDEEVPFPELAQLGGEVMRGFRESRLLGRTAAVATLEYRYPIWAFLDGSVSGAVGNVFGEHFDELDPELLRLAFWGGIRSSEARDHSFDFLMGFGTETFEEGTHLTDFRFVFGAKQGF
jgi:Omp85 superfamily domain